MTKTLADAVSEYGASVKAKLTSPAITGAPEDQLRAPLERFLKDLSEITGLPNDALQLVGETSLAGLGIRPDYAATLKKALVGFIEVKAPGKGADPRHFSDAHDKAQWEKLKSLPNLLYTDGNTFSLWRDGELVDSVVRLEGGIETAGAALSAPTRLPALLSDFLTWTPIPPRTAKQLAQVSARLCRLLRDEVLEQIVGGSAALTGLAEDWRLLLFPQASDKEFADGYAQAVTFGLLVARARNISLAEGIDHAAHELRKTNSLIGSALRLLTDDASNQEALKTSLETLTRVLEAVDWAKISKGNPDAWLYFYEDFLEVYDNALRKRTGSYYTPPEVVSAMVRLVDDVLRDPELFDEPKGFASSDVTVADPAVGTGTFLLGIFRKIAGTIADDQGPGAVSGAVAAAAQRLIGFELQFGPFAVAQLRLIAELHDLIPTGDLPDLRLYVTDTLGNPYVEEERLPMMLQPIAQSRKEANEIKRQEPITVVIGNPPYKEKAKGRGGWVEEGSDGRDAPLYRWHAPADWGIGAHAKHLKNLYIYFWRWATWKVFGTGLHASTGVEENDKAGIVSFITVAGFLNGPGFEKMRDDLRRSCHQIWVIDCSPEGHQPEVATRIFQGVQQPVCIVLAARGLEKDPGVPASVWFHSLPKGRREDKFDALAKLPLTGDVWTQVSEAWRAPFLPGAIGAWASFPPLKDFFLYDGSGVMPGRTWAIAPDQLSLGLRWKRLVDEKDATQKERLFHPQLRNGKVSSRHIRKVVKEDLGSRPTRQVTILEDKGDCETPERYAFRSFDRQWLIADARLLNDVRPVLWRWHSNHQVYVTAIEAASPSSGPAFTISGLVPDQDHYHGRGGRVYPLWADTATSHPNIKPALLTYLAKTYGHPVKAEDVMAYLAAVMAHPAFTQKFVADLKTPGLRVPLTADASLFEEAVRIGREVVWLHCYGERFADPDEGRPKSAPRLPKDRAPRIPADGAIPAAPEPLPDTIDYDASMKRLLIGKGFIDNVTPEMWAYDVSGKNVLGHWFSYRKRDRSKPLIGDRRPPSPLSQIQPESWPAEYTTDLIDLLNVLGRLIDLEPAQADLLARICESPLLDVDELRDSGALGQPDN